MIQISDLIFSFRFHHKKSYSLEDILKFLAKRNSRRFRYWISLRPSGRGKNKEYCVEICYVAAAHGSRGVGGLMFKWF